MLTRRRGSGMTPAAGAMAAVAAIFGLGLVFDLGPFRDDHQPQGASVVGADEICREARDAFAELQRRPPRSASEAVELTASLLEIASDELQRIGELPVPDGDQRALARYLAAREEGIAVLRRGLEAAREGDQLAYAEAQAELARGQLERLRLARAAGLSRCSRPLGSREELARDAEPPTGL